MPGNLPLHLSGVKFGHHLRFITLDLFAANSATLKVGATSAGGRYFSSTAQGQRLYVEGMGEHGDWDRGRLVSYSAEVASMLLKPYSQDRQVHTVEELRVAVEESGLPAYRVWIQEGLVEASRGIWEESRFQTRSYLPSKRTDKGSPVYVGRGFLLSLPLTARAS